MLDDGHREPADLVIATGGAHETFFGLVGREHLGDFVARVDNVAFMESVLMVHVGIDFDPTPYQPAALCYYYNTYDVEGGVDRCQTRRVSRGAGRLSHLCPVTALAGTRAAGSPRGDGLYHRAQPPARRDVGRAARRDGGQIVGRGGEGRCRDLRERAQVRVILTPDDFRLRTHQVHHSFGGAAPVMGKEGVPHRTPIRGLWFIGSQSESRGGVAGVMAGARRAINLIKQEQMG